MRMSGPGEKFPLNWGKGTQHRGVVGKPGIQSDKVFRTNGTTVPFNERKAVTTQAGFGEGQNIGQRAGIVPKTTARGGATV